MKPKILLFSFSIFILISCKRNEEVTTPENNIPIPVQNKNLSKDIYELERFAQNYQPSKIDLSDNEGLNKFDLQYIYGKELKDQDSLRNEIADVLLLKQYFFHLSKYHQGYDLLSMRKGQAKFVIDHFLAKHGLNKDMEILNSGHPYTILQNDKVQSKQVQELCKKISVQQKAIRDRKN